MGFGLGFCPGGGLASEADREAEGENSVRERRDVPMSDTYVSNSIIHFHSLIVVYIIDRRQPDGIGIPTVRK
jgi:hypothetical protein